MEKIWARKRQKSFHKTVLNSLGGQWPVVVKGLRQPDIVQDTTKLWGFTELKSRCFSWMDSLHGFNGEYIPSMFPLHILPYPRQKQNR